MTDKMLEAFDGTRKAGSIASGALDEVAKIIKPGIKTEKIDKLCFEFINDNQGLLCSFILQRFSKIMLYISNPRLFVMEYQR